MLHTLRCWDFQKLVHVSYHNAKNTKTKRITAHTPLNIYCCCNAGCHHEKEEGRNQRFLMIYYQQDGDSEHAH